MRNTLLTLWTIKDFRAGLRFNSNQHSSNGESIVAYDNTQAKTENRYSLVNLTDGCIWESGLTPEQVIHYLNANECVCQKALNRLNRLNT